MPKNKEIRKPDLENIKPEYWERVLESYGLGYRSLVQPMSDNGGEKEGGPVGAFVNRHRFSGSKDKILQTLDSVVGADDRFMQGHQIKKIRVRERLIPEWTIGDQEIKTILLTVFPKMFTEERQHQRASIWLRVFYLYYRIGLTEFQVAREIGINRNQVSMTLRTLTYASKGLTKHGKPRRGRVLSPTTEGTGRKENEGVQGPHVPSPRDGSIGETRTAS